MRKGFEYLVLLAVMFALTGCNLISLDDFRLLNARIVEMNGLSAATVEMTVESTARFNVTVTAGSLRASYNGEEIGELYLKNKVKLKRSSENTVTLELGIRFSSPIAALRAVSALKQHPEEITVSGYGEGRIWFFCKRFERQNVPLSKFMNIFGAPSNYL